MAKNYQRHSKGGRFRRSDIGDAGLRSYQEQQKNIIDAIRLTQQQDKDISRDQIQGLEGVAAKQAQNQTIINNLESNVYKTKEQAIRRTAKSDVEALEGQAREYEKNSEFWKDFSTTYSRHWAKLAQETGEFKDRLWTDKWQDNLIAQYPDLINFEADQLREGIEKTLKKDLIDVQKEIRDNKNTSDDAREEAKTILRLMRRTNTGLDKIKVKQFTENINDIEENLKRTIIQDEQLKWSSDTILQHYKQAAKNLVIRSGIRSNSKEAKELYALFVRKGTAAAAKARDRNDIIKTTEDINYEIEAVLAADDSTRSEKLSDLYTAITVGTFDGKQGKAIRGISNPIDAYFSTAQYLSDRYDDVDTFVEHMQSMAVDDQKGGRILWSERFKKQLPQHEYRLREICLEANKNDIADKKRKKELKDQAGLEEAKAILKRIDITTPEGIQELKAHGLKYAGYTETTKFISTATNFNFEGKNKIYLDDQIIKAWRNGRADEFGEIYSLVDNKTKEKYKRLFDDMDALVKAGQYKEGGIKKHAESVIETKSKIISTLSPEKDLLGKQVDAYEDAFYRRFQELGDQDLTPDERWNEAQKYVDDLVNYVDPDTGEKGLGVFRRKEEGGKVTWLAWEVEQDDSWDSTTIKEKISANTADANIQSLINDHNLGTKSIVHQDTIDEMSLNINNGYSVGVPENIQILFDSQGANAKYKGEEGLRKLVEEITGIELPKGGLDFGKFIEAKQKHLKADTSSMNKTEKVAVNYIRNNIENATGYWPFSKQLNAIVTNFTATGKPIIEITEDDLKDNIRNAALYYGDQK